MEIGWKLYFQTLQNSSRAPLAFTYREHVDICVSFHLFSLASLKTGLKSYIFLYKAWRNPVYYIVSYDICNSHHHLTLDQ